MALEVATVSGDISCRVNVAEVRLKTISGDIEWYGDAGSLQISTTSGEAEASGSITLTRMNSVSGDLTLTLDDGRKAEAEISSTSGDAEIRVPEDTEEFLKGMAEEENPFLAPEFTDEENAKQLHAV